MKTDARLVSRIVPRSALMGAAGTRQGLGYILLSPEEAQANGLKCVDCAKRPRSPKTTLATEAYLVRVRQYGTEKDTVALKACCSAHSMFALARKLDKEEVEQAAKRKRRRFQQRVREYCEAVASYIGSWAPAMLPSHFHQYASGLASDIYYFGGSVDDNCEVLARARKALALLDAWHASMTDEERAMLALTLPSQATRPADFNEEEAWR